MMTRRSIGFRLATWYFSVLAVALIGFGAGVWFAMRHSLYAAVDHTLNDQVRGVAHFIEQHRASLSPEKVRDELRKHSLLGPAADLFQVSDSGGRWLYRSDPLQDAQISAPSTEQLKAGDRYEDALVRSEPVRFLSRNVAVRGQLYAVQVAAPLHELAEGLDRILWILVAIIPAILGVASFVGYWMSRRALVSVDEITNAARSISAQNLSLRLPVPHTGDELQRLSMTLNAMFERLDLAFAQIKRFTADASHELRTPIALMRTTAELALRRKRSGEEYREGLAQILAELERTSTLIEHLLLLARADSGTQMQFSPMDLTQTVREACEQGRVLAEAGQVLFDSNVPETTIWVEGDGQALRRGFLILIDNAVKYTGAGGQVRVSLIRKDGAADITVMDSGIGIAPEDLPRIFDRFYRADKARCREQGGIGLGLAIARWIVEAHRGQIRVESALGQGSTFSVTLPLHTGVAKVRPPMVLLGASLSHRDP